MSASPWPSFGLDARELVSGDSEDKLSRPARPDRGGREQDIGDWDFNMPDIEEHGEFACEGPGWQPGEDNPEDGDPREARFLFFVI